MSKTKSNFIMHAQDIEANAFRFRHPLGEGGSEIILSMLARPAGLTRCGVNFGRVPPGKEAFVYHRHHAEEEWVYIISGEAMSEIEGEKEKVAAGAFVAYPAGVAHSLTNIGQADLVYLMGGERTSVEIADFPRHGKRMLRTGERHDIIDADAAVAFLPILEPVTGELP